MGETKVHHADRIFTALRDGAATAQSALAASWSRSLRTYGLDPDHSRPPRRLSESEFGTAFERTESLTRLAQPVLDRLFQSVGEAGCCVLLTDRDGVPLDRRGVAGDDADFLRLGLWTGMVWSEASEGTNGVGTCLAEGRPLTIQRDQHFLTRNIELSCTVAPIWDARGKLVAALDVSTCRADQTPATLRLIAAATREAAQRIEAGHFRQTFHHARIVLGQDTDCGPGGLLAVDREDLVVGASRAARVAYGLTDAQLARPLPAADVLRGEAAEPAEDLAAAERGALQRALSRTRGNVAAAARLLGVSRATMHRKLARLGLDRRR
ncbi:GAF domain-containing protein [Chelatococcus reniformis]|uniref:Fis family transcriptional regulator n=1 Tax=Chelatococcus reniformis TaxID=1494448 RepID=A0A916UW20_9HYPH|nr:GAF domain-containing protein [Chelatococcus reniformis]GGC89546.1 Fis family transcriptional regulator [Chelatococcus reniformis]